MNPLSAALHINQLRLFVHLGEGELERSQEQPIDIDVSIYFADLPSACKNDDGDFICYDKLSGLLGAKATEKPYRLIEFLCMQLYDVTRAEIVRAVGDAAASRIFVRLCLTKPDAPVEGLLGGSSFEYTDIVSGLAG